MSLTKVNYIDNSTIITAKNLNDIQDNIIDIQDDIINIQDKLQTTNNKTKAGFIYPLANNTVPDGFLLCDGAEYSRNDYPELFAAIGTMYGAGDGTTTFNVPNLSTRVPIGSGDGYELGDVGGEAAHTLTVNEMPSHNHSVHLTIQAGNNGDYFKVSGSGNVNDAATTWRGGYTNTIGGSQPHNNMQPYTVINYIIATGKDTGVSVADIIAGVQALPLGVEFGGTEATNAADARVNLGITPENIGAVNTNNVVNNFTTTEEGFVADAKALKVLNDKAESRISFFITETVRQYVTCKINVIGSRRVPFIVIVGHQQKAPVIASCMLQNDETFLSTSTQITYADGVLSIDQGVEAWACSLILYPADCYEFSE